MNKTLQKDRDILRQLAEQQAEIATLPIQRQTAENWRKLNRLEKAKPMVYIWESQVPWHELNDDGELDLQTQDEFHQKIEQKMRRILYMWNHLRGDMVVEAEFPCPLAIHQTGFGYEIVEDIAQTDAQNEIVGHHYQPQIRDEADIEKIQAPQIYYDAEATEEKYQRLNHLFGDILSVKKRGISGWNISPVDQLFTWWGIQEAMEDLILRPELFHHAMGRLTSAQLSQLDQLDQLNLFSPGNGNQITGQGGLAFTNELPKPDACPEHVRPTDLWGSAQAQIFVGVSPRMHEEFALRYETRILERFGLNYYGCCEPLHRKVQILKKIPRLRKISMSPWIDIEAAATAMGDDFVFSRKPSPAIFAEEAWNPELIKKELVELLQKTAGCILEIILKDVSTVRYQPQRLWEWARIATEVIEEKGV